MTNILLFWDFIGKKILSNVISQISSAIKATNKPGRDSKEEAALAGGRENEVPPVSLFFISSDSSDNSQASDNWQKARHISSQRCSVSFTFLISK